MRRPIAALAFAVALGGALAYAASGGMSDWFGEPGASSSRPSLHGALRAGEGRLPPRSRGEAATSAPDPAAAAEPPAVAATSEETPGAAPSADKLESASKSSGALASKRASPAPAASWRAVDEALDARDDAKAKQALEGLAKSDDVTTRAKARLGLAQLARGRGDCTEARRIAFEVAAMRGVELSVIKHAQAIVLECR